MLPTPRASARMPRVTGAQVGKWHAVSFAREQFSYLFHFQMLQGTVTVLFASTGVAICSQEQEHFPLRRHFSGIGGNSVQYVVPDSFQATSLGGIS